MPNRSWSRRPCRVYKDKDKEIRRQSLDKASVLSIVTFSDKGRVSLEVPTCGTFILSVR